jgi:hypothetical protein
MLSNLFIFKKQQFLNALKCALFTCKSIDFLLPVCLSVVENGKSLNFVHLLIFYAIVHHKRRHDLEFVIVIGIERRYIFNPFLTKNCLSIFSLRCWRLSSKDI